MTRGNKPTTLKIIQGGIVDTVPPPKGLPADAVSDWNVVTSDLAERRLLNDAMLGPVMAYCVALWQVRLCTAAIEKDGVFVTGQGGIPKAHPAASMMQKAQETVNRLSVELGLTPSSRARRGLGGPDGKSSTPDDMDEFV